MTNIPGSCPALIVAALMLLTSAGTASAARTSTPGTGPVVLRDQHGTPLDGIARTLAARDIASSASHGEQALVLIGSARLSTGRGRQAALFVQLQSAALCGSAGCETSVYVGGRHGWSKVLDSVSGPITVLGTSHGHMHDLLIGRTDRWVWSGQAYRDTLLAPSLAGLKRSVERHRRAVAHGQARSP